MKRASRVNSVALDEVANKGILMTIGIHTLEHILHGIIIRLELKFVKLFLNFLV